MDVDRPGEPGGERSGGAAASAPSLGARALTGTLWTTGGYLLRQAIRLASNLVLARLLFPEAFGLMAIVNVFLVGLGMFSDLGIGLNIVQSRRGDERAFLDTAFSLGILRGAALFAAAALAALPVAAFYDLPELRGMIPTAALAVLIQGFFSTGVYRLQRHMSLARFELVELVGQLVPAVVMIAWALVSPTVWALVAGGVAGSAARVIASHWVVPEHRPRLAWDRAASRELLEFGKWVFLSTVLTFLTDQTDRLFLGKLIPLSLLGVYSIAAMMAHLPIQLMTKVGALVAFPTFSRSMEGPDGLAPTFHRVRRALLVLGGLLVVLLGASAQPLIDTLYDDRYREAGWILGLLAARSWLNVLQVPRQSSILALGVPRWLAIANGLKLAAMVALIPLGYRLAGLEGVILGLIGADAVRYASALWANRLFQLGGLASDGAITLGLLCAVALGRLTADGIAAAGSPAFVQLAGAWIMAGAAWLALGAWLLRRERGWLLASLRRRPR